ncbi:rhomboid family-domain-containing protein [Sporodiniella umbellata]|nr:rhomboid family-domain-containing protein [Sporodiniella umbellata]
MYARTGSYQPLLSLPITKRPPLLRRMLWGPVRVPTFSYLSMLTMIGILIYELVRSRQLTGSSIQTSPFNPMIGPSFQVLVNEGARFTPCIRTVPSYSATSVFSNCFGSASDTCTLEELCGFGGFFGGPPNQNFRFVLPIFMHAGVLHFFINMLTHLRLGVDLEKTLGTPRYAILYLASGIWGFVLSAMLSSPSSASTGCSGALFGLIGYMFIDVLIRWKQLAHPLRDLMSLLMSTIISLIIGLFPGLDNFAHLGGFVVGILMGLLIAPKFPMTTLKTKLLMCAVRFLALVGLIVLFVVTIHQLYSVTDPSTICPNCKYLSCIPVSNWCDPI